MDGGSITDALGRLFGASFARCGLEARFGQVVASQRPELGQFQCNGALPAARLVKKNPRELALAVLEALGQREIFRELSVAGAGFINITVTGEYLAGFLRELAEDERLGCRLPGPPRSVVVDFGGPNVAKAMHVGHLRSSIIGDCLQRVFRFLGDRVTSDVHLGDWGTQMGMLLCELRRRQPELLYFDPSYEGPYSEEPPVTVGDLEEMYPAAAARAKADPGEAEAARQATLELQRGRPGYRALWQKFVEVSVRELRKDFDQLGVRFDLWLGESHSHDRIPALLARLTREGHAVESEGALVVPLPPEPGEPEAPPLLLRKSDGAAMYGTTDLATLLERVEHGADLLLYVVDQRQSLHFQQVFRAARRTSVSGGAELEHIAFGTVNGPDGKPFKTRAGGVMKLQDLISLAVAEVEKRMAEAGVAQAYPEAERSEIAKKVGVAAVKFADLSNHRLSNYVFDVEKFTRFEGKTGPYLLYAAVRIQSILRNVEQRGYVAGPLLAPTEPEEELMLLLAQLPDALRTAYQERAPNFLCEHAYAVAQAFSRFYQQCHILSEADEARRGSWISLARLCLLELTELLSLLGMEVPERM
jgi:arginyl-tRNA synthetase